MKPSNKQTFHDSVAMITLHSVESTEDSLFKEWYTEIYLKSFPKNERIPLSEFKKEFELLRKPNAPRVPIQLIAVSRGKVVSGLFGAFLKTGKMGYNMFLATRKELRSQGIGTQLREHLGKLLVQKYDAQGIISETEILDHVIPGEQRTERAKFHERLNALRFEFDRTRGGYHIPNPVTNSLYKGTTPMDIRFTPLTAQARNALQSPQGRTRMAYRVLLSLYKGRFGFTHKSPKYPRTIANITVRRVMNKLLSRTQVRKTRKKIIQGRMLGPKHPKPIQDVPRQLHVLPELKKKGISIRALKQRIRLR